jgi:hypothetical protein
MQPVITVRVDRNYGVKTVYPVSKEAQLFAKIAGTKTLTRHTLRDVKELGYRIETTEHLDYDTET